VGARKGTRGDTPMGGAWLTSHGAVTRRHVAEGPWCVCVDMKKEQDDNGGKGSVQSNTLAIDARRNYGLAVGWC
jgi:hypothetical protein